MKRGTLLITIVALCVLGNAACGGGHHHVIPPPPATQNFTFYASGEDILEGGDTYSIAGVFSITADGTVTAGEQDYNNGDGDTSPQPGGDTITGGSLVFNPDGSGNAILLLNTNNGALGNGGAETFAISFPNPNHALITQFDGSATSSGSLDLQTATALPDGAFSFVAYGQDGSGNFLSVVDGGIFTVTAGAIAGTVDVNDGGNFTLNTAFTGALGTPDSFGRGTITNDENFPTSFNYYVVGPECIRFVDVDASDTAVGSAYSHGDSEGSFSNASIGQSVFSIGASGLASSFYAGAGQFTTDAGGAAKPKSNSKTHSAIPEGGLNVNTFNGVGDINELDEALDIAVPISGTYTLASDGYGSMAFAAGFGDVGAFGVYAVDPTLNIQDPNNTSDGGGALVAEMDANLAGIGSIVPQTDITTASFEGSYAFAAQGNTDIDGDEFDFLGTASMSSDTEAFAGSGSLGDPFAAIFEGGVLSDTVSFAATAVPDGVNPGRYTFSPLALTGPDIDGEFFLTFGIYQASGGQLFWVDIDDSGIEAGGSLQQVPGSGTDAKKARPNNKKH